MPHPTFTTPNLTTFTGLDALGLVATGQHLTDKAATLECRIAEPDPWCTQCGATGAPRGTISRRLTHVPYGHRPTTLLLRVRRYTCTGCSRFWQENTSAVAPARAKLTRTALTWALRALVLDHLSINRVAGILGVSWSTSNTAILGEGQRRLIQDKHRFDGVTVLGVDEHVWRHTRRGDKYVTVIIDLTPIKEGTGPARLLDMVEGRSKKTFKQWLSGRPAARREKVEVVAMDGFTGFKTATSEELPGAVAVMDPFHVIHLAAEVLQECRRRVQQDCHGRRGRAGDPLFQGRRLLLTGATLHTEKQRCKVQALLQRDEYVPVAATWGVYQAMVDAYRHQNRRIGKFTMRRVIDSLRGGVPEGLVEATRLGRTLAKRAGDILAYFDRPGTSNGPTEAINGRLEHLRGSAVGFRNLANYVARSLLEAGGFRARLHARLR